MDVMPLRQALAVLWDIWRSRTRRCQICREVLPTRSRVLGCSIACEEEIDRFNREW